ncbi:hypothetical protein [Nitratireductor pacificus]|uniref:Uncharacterized protein n=1 Tax=Nitratireductor pacificus pht-3B TaxID=391937 RepID=K2LGF1_9HYPH|nr:hypothetical protein [Nitratireductor pacificus]EKF16839.1 hypothetical protein NA2_21018 [Nitratireductor pacificus pht-3B]
MGDALPTQDVLVCANAASGRAQADPIVMALAESIAARMVLPRGDPAETDRQAFFAGAENMVMKSCPLD